MSDRLSNLLQQVVQPKRKSDNPDQRVIDALEKALETTTPERAGCPWDVRENGSERSENPGGWLPASEE